ncbi:hypothetical protein evm_009745 [Chilo suppressalis]|nr:hypothetical protein evm_009745 [Chilo suppressalis]
MKSGDVTLQSFSERKTVKMFLKLALLCSVLSCVRAAPASTDVVPLEKQQPTVIPIVSQSEELESNGTFKFSYETGNGIKREEISYEKVIPKARSAGSEEGGENDESNEIHVQQGSYSYVAPDGTVISLKYIADENGFRPVGDHIPRAPVLVPQSLAGNSEKSGRALKPDTKKAESANVSPNSAKSEPLVAPKEVASKDSSPLAPETSPVASEESDPKNSKVTSSSAAEEPKAAAPVEATTIPEASSKAVVPEATETALSTTAVSSAEFSSSAETASTTEAAFGSKSAAEQSSPKTNSLEQSISTESVTSGGVSLSGDVSNESASLSTNSS